jgi:ATP-dependent DNA ligase
VDTEPQDLRPPLAVMRPSSTPEIPAQDALPGGAQFSIKLDGFRALAFPGADRTVLQSRSGRDLAPDFRALAASLGSVLEEGVVLDGEICAWSAGRFDFTALLRSPAARATAGVVVGYVAFDVLAVPGRDVRQLPLRERWSLLTALLADTAPAVRPVLATTDRELALQWFTDLAPLGIEGIVSRALASRYLPSDHTSWRKTRHFDPVDGRLVAVHGPPRRPHGVVAELADNTRLTTTVRLDTVAAAQVGAAVAGRLTPAGHTADGRTVHQVSDGPVAEFHVVSGRHGSIRFVRLRRGD